MLVLGANGSIQARKGNDMRHCPKCLINFPSSPYPESFPEASCPLCSANDEIDRIKKENEGLVYTNSIKNTLITQHIEREKQLKSRIDRAVEYMRQGQPIHAFTVLTEGTK